MEKGFQGTYYWDEGDYDIYVKKPGYKDYKETLKVTKNPTDYLTSVKLAKE